MNTPLLLSLLYFILLCGCSDSTGISRLTPEGRFIYTAFDSAGVEILDGTLELYMESENAISGSWRFSDGNSGLLEGRLSGNNFFLNLNPGYVDNNLYLNGRLSESALQGTWEKIGFPGVLDRGTFVAIRQWFTVPQYPEQEINLPGNLDL